MEVLDARRMQQADRFTIETLKIPGLVLMENAGRRVADVIARRFAELDSRGIVVLAGKGNNGGDGFVTARHLAGPDPCNSGIEILLVGARLSDLNGDAATMAQAWIGSGGRLHEVADRDAWLEIESILGSADLIIDAILGTGLRRAPRGLPALAIAAINEASAAGKAVVSIDLPSGLAASDAHPPGLCVQAGLTVTFARPKPCQLLPPSEDACGDLVVVDIGIPDAAIAATRPDLFWTTAEAAARLLVDRECHAHKGTFGHVLVVAGSRGKSGAATLTGRAALAAGAGLVTVATPAEIRPEVASATPELMTATLPGTRSGRIGTEAAPVALASAASKEVLALGPGLGHEGATGRAIREIVKTTPIPLVLDADGLNAFSGRARRSLRHHPAPLIVTPHPGEAARLLGTTTSAVQADRLDAARRIAAAADAVCVLKGYRTIVASPEGDAHINPTGNPGMASAGMGDLLTGLLAGFVAQGLTGLEAALLGTYLHGLAGDLACRTGESEETLSATGLLRTLPEAFRRLRPDETGPVSEHGP